MASKLPRVVDPATLEAIACQEAQALAADLNVTHILIAKDIKQLLEDIKTGTGGLHDIIAKEIISIMYHFASCSFIFESRVSNNLEEHSLAKLALDFSVGRHSWLLQPPDLNCIHMNTVTNQ